MGERRAARPPLDAKGGVGMALAVDAAAPPPDPAEKSAAIFPCGLPHSLFTKGRRENSGRSSFVIFAKVSKEMGINERNTDKI